MTVQRAIFAECSPWYHAYGDGIAQCLCGQRPAPRRMCLGGFQPKQVIAVSGVKTHRISVQLLLVTVNAFRRAGISRRNAQALVGLGDSRLQ